MQDVKDDQEVFPTDKTFKSAPYIVDTVAGEHGIGENAAIKDIREVMSEALFSRFRKGATADKLGFCGFEGKIVADVGTRDGRFVPMFYKLGAKEVFGIDPDRRGLEEAVSLGILDREHAINTKFEEIPEELKGKIDICAVLNFNIPLLQRKDFIKALHDSLSSNGEIIVTVAETEILRAIFPIFEKYFEVKSQRLWGGFKDTPHAYLIIGSKL